MPEISVLTLEPQRKIKPEISVLMNNVVEIKTSGLSFSHEFIVVAGRKYFMQKTVTALELKHVVQQLSSG